MHSAIGIDGSAKQVCFGQFAYSKIDLSVCTLSQPLSPTETLLSYNYVVFIFVTFSDESCFSLMFLVKTLCIL